MADDIFFALTRITPLTLTLAFLCYVLIAISLWRLKSIQALDMRRPKNRWIAAENLAHSMAKLFLITLCCAAIIRAIAAPDYPAGVFAIDAALFTGLAISILASVPSIWLIALLSRSMSKRRSAAGPAALFSLGSVCVLVSGAGQLLAAAAFSGYAIDRILQNLSYLFAWLLVAGLILTLGVAAHFSFIKTVIEADRAPAAAILKDATIAVAPTFFAAIIGALALHAAT